MGKSVNLETDSNEFINNIAGAEVLGAVTTGHDDLPATVMDEPDEKA